MKYRFLKTIALTLPLSIALVLGIKMCTLYRMEQAMDMSLPDGTRVLVLGNSHGRDAICDTMLPGWANRCSDGEIYTGVYSLAKRLLEHNSIDTLVVPMMDFVTYRDDRLTTSYLLYESSRMAIADKRVLTDFTRLDWRNMLSFYMTNEIKAMTRPVEVGGYEHWDHHGLQTDIANYESQREKEGVIKAPRDSIASFSMMTTYLERTAQLCASKGVQMVILNYPKYQREKYYERSKAWDYYATLPTSVLIADYEHFALPDTTYYANTTHLNYRGAEFFTKHIKEHGLKTLTPRQWRATRHD
ncbi:MAG: hypothetical protein MJZ74_10805 [Muribaculaceae bacterium]|nr:hypothetical protein [Muribaculaceae bacterium]